MGITWIPPAPTPGVSGTASCVSGSTVHGEWLSCNKGETIFGEVATTHSAGISCGVTHVCNPPAPPGMTITNTATGITVTGMVTDILNTPINTDYTLKQNDQPDKVNQPTTPPNSILTHYTPLSTDHVLYTITVTATWKHDTNVTTPYTLDWIVVLYNAWVPEKNAVKSIVQGQN